MKTQFGNDPKRTIYERALKISAGIIVIVLLAIQIFSILHGTTTWSEAIKSDWVWVFITLGYLRFPFALYASLIFLPAVVWLQLGVEVLRWQVWRHASWEDVWLPTGIWLLFVAFFLFMVITGKLFSKRSKAVKS